MAVGHRLDELGVLLLLAGVTGDNLLWDIIQVNNITNIILISDQPYGPGNLPHDLWGCDYLNNTMNMTPPLPALMTIIIDCPQAPVRCIIHQTLHALSMGKKGILMRPVVNWILTSPPDDLDLFSDLMSKADSALVLYNEISGPSYINLTKVYKTPDGVTVQQNISGRVRDIPEVLTGIIPAHFTGLNSEHVTVGCVKQLPFAYELNTNDTINWAGVALEFVQALADKYSFRYSTVRSRDGAYGGKRSDGTWNGLIGMVLDEEIDIIATGLTATASRWTVLDFAFPYYITHYGLMLQVHTEEWFTFLKPLQNQLWLLYILSGFVVSLVTFTFSRWPVKHMIHFKYRKSWHIYYRIVSFSMGALFQQGGKFNPSPTRLRFVIGSFWVLVLVICATYSGNLVASLSTHRVKLPFTTLQEFADQDVYLPSVVQSTNAMTVLMETRGDAFRKLSKKMRDNPALALKPGTDPIATVESGPFVYIATKVLLKSMTVLKKDCSLFTLPDGFGSSQKALAFPKHSPFVPYFSQIVTQLLEGGIDRLWWENHFPKDKCAESLKVSAEAKPVTVNTLAGLFLILISGVLLSFIVLMIEYVLYHRQTQHESK